MAIVAAAELADDVAEARLVCLARLLGEVAGERSVDLLIDVLASEPPGARVEAGEQLLGVALDSFEDLAAGVQRALDRLPPDSPALLELPYLLAETRHDRCGEPLAALLGHPAGDVAAAAIEGLVLVGDPAAIERLAELEEDARRCSVGADEGAPVDATVGEVARQAVELLTTLARTAPSPDGEREP
jgi:HEAT repeat protein